MPDPRVKRTARELFLSILAGGAGDLDTWVMDRMTSLVEEEDVEAGKRLFARGEPPEYMFFLRDGRVRLEREGAGVWLLHGRAVVGAFDALLDRPHTRTAVAETHLQLLKLRVDQWLDLLENSFALARAAVANSVATVSAAEARLWATQAQPRGTVLAPTVALGAEPLAFIERLALLADTPLFGGAGIQVLVEIADAIEEQAFEPGEPLFERGKGLGRAFLALEGEAVGDGGHEGHAPVRFGPGSLIGGVASLGQPILGWQARAVTRVRTLSLRLEDWFDDMEEHFDLVRSALSTLALMREALLDDLSAAQPGELRVA